MQVYFEIIQAGKCVTACSSSARRLPRQLPGGPSGNRRLPQRTVVILKPITVLAHNHGFRTVKVGVVMKRMHFRTHQPSVPAAVFSSLCACVDSALSVRFKILPCQPSGF